MGELLVGAQSEGSGRIVLVQASFSLSLTNREAALSLLHIDTVRRLASPEENYGGRHWDYPRHWG